MDALYPGEMSLGKIKSQHHYTWIRYPSSDLLDQDRESIALEPVHNIQHRYEPLPLIEDEAVKAHAFRDSEEETRFFSLTPAEMCEAEEIPWRLGGWFGGNDRTSDSGGFAMDMEHLTSLRGETIVNVVLYRRQEEEEEVYIRLKRCSTIRSPAGPGHLMKTYDFSLSAFSAIRCDDRLWYANAVDSIYRISDRAVLQVRQVMHEQGYEEAVEGDWKPRERKPDYCKAVLSETFQLSTEEYESRSEEDRTCGACLSEQDEYGEDAYSTLECREHVFHFACLEKWIEAQGPDNVNCPQCRQPMFTEEDTVPLLKFGVKGKSYARNPMYDQWENFERFCADLDVRLAEDNNDPIICDSVILSSIIEELSRGERLEQSPGPSHTPQYLRPGFCAEVALLGQAMIAKASDMYDDVTLPTKAVYAMIIDEVHRYFAQQFFQENMHIGLREEEMMGMAKGDQQVIRDHTMQPGFYPFVRRLLNRALQFYHLRRCDCMGGLIHRHGERLYYGESEWRTEAGDGEVAES